MSSQGKTCRLSVGSCMESALEQARLRILVVGDGIAGATLAALLRQRGEQPVVIERGHADDAGGYVLGLYPLGGRVLHGLGMYRRYQEISTRMERYFLHGRTGKVITEFSLAEFAEKYGDVRGVDRKKLLMLLRSAIPREHVFYNTSIQHLQNSDQGAVVTFSDGSAQEFDLVVGADGIHSDVRGMVLTEKEYAYRATGWGGWGLWRSLEGFDEATYREMWADGWFVGMYPVHNKLAVFIGGSKELLSKFTATQFAALLRSKLPAGILHSALQSLEGLDNAFFWNMEDCRASLWHRKRTVLLGDAASAFLPTAGIGASMAMDSAAVLADELSRTDADHLPYALDLYTKRQKKRVELTQKNSRFLAKVMLQNSSSTSKLRDALVRMYSLQGLLKDIQKVMDGG